MPSRLAATFIEEVFHTKIPPTLDGLRTLEMLLVSQQAGAIRWIPPMLFQALCDFIGVLGQTLFDRDIAWPSANPTATSARHRSSAWRWRAANTSPSASPAGGLTEAVSGERQSREQRAECRPIHGW